MNVRTALVIPFALVRVPLYVVDRQVSRRWAPDSGIRIAFDRSLGTVDAWVGRVIDDPGISTRGLDRTQSARRLAAPAVTTTARARSRRRYATTRPAGARSRPPAPA